MAAVERGRPRSKPSGLKSFLHRRNNSDGSVLPSSFSTPLGPSTSAPDGKASLDMGLPGFSRLDRALGELEQNQLDPASRSPDRSRDGRHHTPRSPVKSALANLSMKSQAARDAARVSKSRDPSPSKPKKSKSVTNFAGLLTRPKSLRNLHKLASDDQIQTAKDKENRTPTNSLDGPPPIYAQFCPDVSPQPPSHTVPVGAIEDPFVATRAAGYGLSAEASPADRVFLKPRPKSFQPPYVSKHEAPEPVGRPGRDVKKAKKDGGGAMDLKAATMGKKERPPRPKVLTAFSGFGGRSKTATASAAEPAIDPKDIDTHLEAMLDRRNIPENQRYKMRNLTSTIKMEFIRQDWAEEQAKTLGRPPSHDGEAAGDNSTGSVDKPKTKHSRMRSLTLSKGGSKTPSSPTKKAEGTLGRHFRTKSAESVASDGPDSAATSSSGSGILAKLKPHHSPEDFVSYLQKIQKPELVEVGKLHKLRLLLRNETVAWTDSFIQKGGMKEIVGLLHRIMEIEWREEHDDALLHENLLCLKALCTTALALQYLHSIQATLLPALIHMLFDPEKKGPSEFTTRGIITSVLFTYIQSAAPHDRPARAQTVLGYLRDPEAKEEERPVSFVLEMRRERPYRVWCKEVVSVTKEVFWIFLHNLNVVALPADQTTKGGQPLGAGAGAAAAAADGGDPAAAYMARHFPQERPPVPAAPYVGGVEWDATNYLASHVDLLNAILACTPSAAARNALRDRLRVSGFERCLGGSLRLCKEKFYGAVHDGLRTWAAAAHDDGWDVRDVRYGPPPEARSSPRKRAAAAAAAKKKEEQPPPRIEMSKLDFGLGGPL